MNFRMIYLVAGILAFMTILFRLPITDRAICSLCDKMVGGDLWHACLNGAPLTVRLIQLVAFGLILRFILKASPMVDSYTVLFGYGGFLVLAFFLIYGLGSIALEFMRRDREKRDDDKEQK